MGSTVGDIIRIEGHEYLIVVDFDKFWGVTRISGFTPQPLLVVRK